MNEEQFEYICELRKRIGILSETLENIYSHEGICPAVLYSKSGQRRSIANLLSDHLCQTIEEMVVAELHKHLKDAQEEYTTW